MRKLWVILVWVGLLAGPVMGAASDVDVQVFANTTAVVPGRTFQLAIVMTPSPGWHIYWRNPGDAGLATKVVVEAPAGYEAGALQFPLPMKFNEAGGIVDYGYRGKTVFLMDVKAGNSVAMGGTAGLRVKASWLSCSDRCVPGQASVEVSLPVSDTALAANSEIFDGAFGFMPASSEFELRSPDVSSLRSNKTEGGIDFAIQWNRAVQDVDLFPVSTDMVSISDVSVRTEDRESHIDLKARGMGNAKLPEHLPVLIVYQEKSGQRMGFYADLLHPSMLKLP